MYMCICNIINSTCVCIYKNVLCLYRFSTCRCMCINLSVRNNENFKLCILFPPPPPLSLAHTLTNMTPLPLPSPSLLSQKRPLADSDLVFPDLSPAAAKRTRSSCDKVDNASVSGRSRRGSFGRQRKKSGRRMSFGGLRRTAAGYVTIYKHVFRQVFFTWGGGSQTYLPPFKSTN